MQLARAFAPFTLLGRLGRVSDSSRPISSVKETLEYQRGTLAIGAGFPFAPFILYG